MRHLPTFFGGYYYAHEITVEFIRKFENVAFALDRGAGEAPHPPPALGPIFFNSILQFWGENGQNNRLAEPAFELTPPSEKSWLWFIRVSMFLDDSF